MVSAIILWFNYILFTFTIRNRNDSIIKSCENRFEYLVLIHLIIVFMDLFINLLDIDQDVWLILIVFRNLLIISCIDEL